MGPQICTEGEPASETQKGEDLTETQRQDLRALEKKYKGLFSKIPGKTSMIEHAITMKGKQVVRTPPRRWPKHLEKNLLEEVEVME